MHLGGSHVVFENLKRKAARSVPSLECPALDPSLEWSGLRNGTGDISISNSDISDISEISKKLYIGVLGLHLNCNCTEPFRCNRWSTMNPCDPSIPVPSRDVQAMALAPLEPLQAQEAPALEISLPSHDAEAITPRYGGWLDPNDRIFLATLAIYIRN